jgi:large subunit ribosomal protein L9
MKVILLKDVRKVGKKFETKDVADGYALNFLIPRKLAEASTPSSMKKVENLKSRDAAEKKVQEDLLKKNLASLNGVTIEMKENANEKGNLFKGIHKEEIIEALKKQGHIAIAPEYLILEKPIKETGEYELEAKVQDLSAKFKLAITAK